MNKPYWKDAPKWAEWLGRDATGSFWRYEKEPRQVAERWISQGGKWHSACFDWYLGEPICALERRPEVPT